MKYVLLLATMALSACASSIMESYVGQDVSAVAIQYGPPHNAFELPDGRTAFQWNIASQYAVPATTTFNAYGSGTSVFGTATTTGGYVGSQECLYTLFGQPNASNSFTIIGFEPPRVWCE